MPMVACSVNRISPGTRMSVQGPAGAGAVCHRIVVRDGVAISAVKVAVFPSCTVCAAGSTMIAHKVGLTDARETGAVAVVGRGVDVSAVVASFVGGGGLALAVAASSAIGVSAAMSRAAVRSTHRVLDGDGRHRMIFPWLSLLLGSRLSMRGRRSELHGRIAGVRWTTV
jgi:hypothetical protein